MTDAFSNRTPPQTWYNKSVFHCYNKMLHLKHVSSLEFWTIGSHSTAVQERLPDAGTVNQECLCSWLFFFLSSKCQPDLPLL